MTDEMVKMSVIELLCLSKPLITALSSVKIQASNFSYEVRSNAIFHRTDARIIKVDTESQFYRSESRVADYTKIDPGDPLVNDAVFIIRRSDWLKANSLCR